MSAGGATERTQSSGQSFIAEAQLPFLQNLWQQGQQYSDPAAVQRAAQGAAGITQPLLGDAMTSTAALMDPSAQIAAQSASLQSGLGQMFREEINPTLESNAIMAGGYGGGRQGVAQGVAAGQLGQAYTQGLGDITARANQQAMGAASMMPALAGAYGQGAMQPQMAGLDPLARLAAILGAPTVLDTRQSTGRSDRFQFGFPGFGTGAGG